MRRQVRIMVVFWLISGLGSTAALAQGAQGVQTACTIELPSSYTVTESNPGSTTAGTLTITTNNYEAVISKSGFRYSFLKPTGGTYASAHPSSGLLFGPSGIAPSPVAETQLVDTGAGGSQPYNSVTLRARNAQNTWAEVRVYPRQNYLKLTVTPPAGASYTIDLRTAAVQPAYGLGDTGGQHTSTNLMDGGLTDNDLHNRGGMNRWLSTFTVFPSVGMAQVLFEDGRKRVGLEPEDNENRLGADGVGAVDKLYYFFGGMEQIYCSYKAVRDFLGYRNLQPRYEFFEVGYETWGALGWDTDQFSIQNSILDFEARGYPLSWAVVGSGFWRGDRVPMDHKGSGQGSTTSFGLWDDTPSWRRDGQTCPAPTILECHEPPPDACGLRNPRFESPSTLKSFFANRGMKLFLGLRSTFKALPEHQGTWQEALDGRFSPDGLSLGYFVGGPTNPTRFQVVFPEGKVYLLDSKNPTARSWFSSNASLWGVDGFKEDTMLLDPRRNAGALPYYDDAHFNRVNEELVASGRYIMVRNGAYSVPGSLLRLEDTNYRCYGSDKDRPLITALSMAASGAPNVYPDIVGGGNLPRGNLAFSEDMKKYFVRNALMSAVMPGMAMGMSPARLDPDQQASVLAAARWHKKFAPYIYSAAMDSHVSGYPYTMTPLPIAFPQDAATYNQSSKGTQEYEWMLGPSILAAPRYGSGYALDTRNVYFPAGKWVDFNNGATYFGPCTASLTYTQNQLPVFIGGKGTLVFQRLADESSPGQLMGRIYAIAGQGTEYVYNDKSGQTTRITQRNVGWNSATLQVRESPAGSTSYTVVAHTFHVYPNGASSCNPSGATTPSVTFPIIPGRNYELWGGN